MTAAEVGHLVTVVDERLRLVGGGFGVEVVLVFPVIGCALDEPIIAAAGNRDRVRVRPAQVFRYAIRRRADSVVLGHNHPTDTGPSAADHAVTRRLVAAGQIVGVPLLAHLVSEPRTLHELVGGRSWPRTLQLPV